jgi:hypothetical protein
MKSRLLAAVGLMVLVTLVFAVGGISAQGEVPPAIDPGQVPALPDFLRTLAGPAGWVLLGAFVSALLARWDWFNRQPPAFKGLVPVALAAALSILAQVLLTYVPASFWTAAAPYWTIIAGAAVTWLGSQGWFQLVEKPAQAPKIRGISPIQMAKLVGEQAAKK